MVECGGNEWVQGWKGMQQRQGLALLAPLDGFASGDVCKRPSLSLSLSLSLLLGPGLGP